MLNRFRKKKTKPELEPETDSEVSLYDLVYDGHESSASGSEPEDPGPDLGDTSLFSVLPSDYDRDENMYEFDRIDFEDLEMPGKTKIEELVDKGKYCKKAKFNRILEVSHAYEDFIASNERQAKVRGIVNFIKYGTIAFCHLDGVFYVVDGQHRLFAMQVLRAKYKSVKFKCHITVTIASNEADVERKYFEMNGKGGTDTGQLFVDRFVKNIIDEVAARLVNKYGDKIIRIHAKKTFRPQMNFSVLADKLREFLPEFHNEDKKTVVDSIFKSIESENKKLMGERTRAFWESKCGTKFKSEDKFDAALKTARDRKFILGMDRNYMYVSTVYQNLKKAVS